jgi:hypothetical protein
MDDSGRTKKVELQQALRSMVNDIARSATRSGMKPEGLVVEIRFSFEEDGERGLRPIVFLGDQLNDYDVHRLRVTLGVNPAQFVNTDASRRDGVANIQSPGVQDVRATAPRIIVPSKPILKLRKAPGGGSTTEADGADRPVQRIEVELSPGMALPVVVEQSSSVVGTMRMLGERIVVFDHQCCHSKRRHFDAYDTTQYQDDDCRDSTEVSSIPPHSIEE